MASHSASTYATLTATASKCFTRCRAPSGRSTTTYSLVRRPGAVASLALGMPRSAATVRLLGGKLPRNRWLACPKLENILGRHAKHDLTDRLVVQYAPLALVRDCVDVAQTAFERIFLEHRHRAAIVKQRIDDLP